MGGKRFSSPGGPHGQGHPDTTVSVSPLGRPETWPLRGRAVGAARELCGADGGGPGLRAWSVGRAGLGTTPWGHREAEGHGGVGSRGVMPNAWGRVGGRWDLSGGGGPEESVVGVHGEGGGGALWGSRRVENRRDLRRRVRRPVGASRPSPPRVLGILWPRPGGAGRAIPICRSSSWGSRGGPSSGRLGLPSWPNSWPNLSTQGLHSASPV
jgi:hypothetical protein